MWNPPIELSPAEQKIAARTQKARKCFGFLRRRRHELLDADVQQTLAERDTPAPGGTVPVDAGVLARATRLQAYGTVGDREAVERTVRDTRWQRVRDGLGAEPPPCSQGTRFHVRLRLIPHHRDKTWRERTVTWAETTGGFGARPLRAALDSTPLVGAGRVEDPCNLRGPALRQAVGLAAQEVGTAAEAIVEDAGLVLGGPRRLTAALDLEWGKPTARESARRRVLAAGERGKRWLEQPPSLSAYAPPLQAMLDTVGQMLAQDTERAPEAGAGERRLTDHVAPDRRLSREDADRRHGRKRRSKTFNGVNAHVALDVDRHVTRAVVVCPATHPAHAAVARLAAELANGPGLLQLDIDLGSMASPRMAPWAAQGVPSMARPWPQGPLFTKPDCPRDFPHGTLTCPTGQTVPMVPGKDAQFPASACDACPVRAPCTKARLGHGRSLTIREDEPFQHKRRAKIKTTHGRASLRKRTAVAHAISHHVAHQGRRARYKGLRKHPCDGRRHAAVSNLQVAARYEEEHRLAS